MLSPKLIVLLLAGFVLAVPPTKYGYILYPAFAPLDVFGPLEALGELAFITPNLNVTIIAETLDPVFNGRASFWVNPLNSTVSEYILPTHTFETAPLDVLIIPGGIGSRAPVPLLSNTIAFVKGRYPTLQYLITVCTGAGIAARAGVLDGKHATTNKRAWDETTALGPKTTSGVVAGTDGFLAFLEAIYGKATAKTVSDGMEYERHFNSTDDPFAALYNLTDANNGTNPCEIWLRAQRLRS